MSLIATLPPSSPNLRERAKLRQSFVDEVGKTLGVLKHQQLSEIRVGTVMREVFSAARSYGVQVEPNFATLVVGTAVIEGVGRQVRTHGTLKRLDKRATHTQRARSSTPT